MPKAAAPGIIVPDVLAALFHRQERHGRGASGTLNELDWRMRD
jgi:hypothetical protein